MQKVIDQFLKKIPLGFLPGRKKSRHYHYAIFFILLFAGITECAPTWSAQALRGFGSLVPSVDVVYRILESISENKMTRFINEQLQTLPRRFTKVDHKHRPKNIYLIIDFHRDSSYSKVHPKGVTKGQLKNSTQYAWSYLTAELLIGKRRHTIAMVDRHKNERIVDHVSRLFAEIPKRFHFQAVIFDGEFPSVDVLRFFHQKNLHFLGRFPSRGDFKQIMKNAADTPEAKAKRFWIQTCITNKANEDAFFEVTWEWTPGGPKLLIKDIDWKLTIHSAEEIYGKRFNIESGFRDTHLFQPHTNSSNISVRLMLIFIGKVWENMMEYCSESGSQGTIRKQIMMKQIRTFKFHALFEMVAMIPTMP
jgi:hypothetical protein